jgi:hypothetical protein
MLGCLIRGLTGRERELDLLRPRWLACQNWKLPVQLIRTPLRPGTAYAAAISGAAFLGMFAKNFFAFAAIWSFVRSCLCVAMDHWWP